MRQSELRVCSNASNPCVQCVLTLTPSVIMCGIESINRENGYPLLCSVVCVGERERIKNDYNVERMKFGFLLCAVKWAWTTLQCERCLARRVRRKML